MSAPALYDCVVLRDGEAYRAIVPQLPWIDVRGANRDAALARAAEELEMYASECWERCRDLPAYERTADLVMLAAPTLERGDLLAGCMTLGRAAQALDVSRSRVSKLVQNGVLDVRQIGGRRMVTAESVERYGSTRRPTGKTRSGALGATPAI